MRARYSRALAASLALATVAALPLAAQAPEPIPQPAAGMVEASVRRELTAAYELVVALSDADGARRAVAYGELGELYAAYGLFDAARAAFRNARALQPGEARWTYLLGYAEAERGDLEAAADAFAAVTAADSADVAAWLRLGEAHLGLGSADAARRAFERALALDGGAAAHFGLARVFIHAGGDAAAIGHFQRALELQPGASRLRYPLAQALRRAGRTDEARTQLTQRGDAPVTFADPRVEAVGRRAAGGAFRKFQGDQAVLRGDFAAAEAAYRQAVAADPENYDYRKSLGLTLARLDRSEEAADELAATLDLDPGEHRRDSEKALLHYTIASLAFNRGVLYAAFEHLKAVFAVDDEHVDAYVLMGNVLGLRRDLEAALRYFDRALELEPDHPKALLQRATTLMDLGRFAEAVASLERKLELEPGDEHAAGLLDIARQRSGG